MGCHMLKGMAKLLAKLIRLPLPKRRWAQLSLRTMLVLVTALCIALAAWVVPAERQRRAVAAIEAAGGWVGYTDNRDPFAAEYDNPPETFLQSWLPRDYFDDVFHVDLSDTLTAGHDITEAERRHRQLVRYLSVFKHVEALDLSHCRIRDSGLLQLQGMKRLRVLNLSDTPITDLGLSHLRELTALEQLNMGRTRITDAGLAHLQALTGLQALLLYENAVTDAGLMHLPVLKALEELDLALTQVTDAGLSQLRFLPRLRNLDLALTSVTDAGLTHLRGLANLSVLRLDGAEVSDDGLAQLQTLTGLDELYLEFTHVSESGLATARQALPNCTIYGPRSGLPGGP